jgi:hypothetical protein
MRRKPSRRPSAASLAGHRPFSPLALVGILITVVLTLGAGAVLVLPHLGTHAAAGRGNCILLVPPNPLSAQGLATPYRLLPPCHEADQATAAFVQGAVVDTDTGIISVYNPLVIDEGTRPAIPPVFPQLPANHMVALWFGFNGNTLTLQGEGVRQGNCVDGLVQFAYCNAPAFFKVVNQNPQVKIPALGTSQVDGKMCPTVRDFSIVDQDQSDNTTTTYLLTPTGQTAQNTAANRAALGSTLAKNPSDERLLTLVDAALGCTPYEAPDLADNGNGVPALPLNELQAAAFQRAPSALVPANDPFVLVNGQPNLQQLNAYRLGVDQPPAASLADASTTAYCRNLLQIAPARLALDKPFTQAKPSPDPAVASNLFAFLAQRFVFTFENQGLNCTGLLKVTDPVTLTFANGVVVDATIQVG